MLNKNIQKIRNVLNTSRGKGANCLKELFLDVFDIKNLNKKYN